MSAGALHLRVTAIDPRCAVLSIFVRGVFPGEMAALKDMSLLLGSEIRFSVRHADVLLNAKRMVACGGAGTN